MSCASSTSAPLRLRASAYISSRLQQLAPTTNGQILPFFPTGSSTSTPSIHHTLLSFPLFILKWRPKIKPVSCDCKENFYAYYYLTCHNGIYDLLRQVLRQKSLPNSLHFEVLRSNLCHVDTTKMPSPFTSSFASAAAGNSSSEGGANGRNTGSGDWYVTQKQSPPSAPQ